MAWTAPKVWVANATLTAAELNEQLSDNMRQTMPAKATREGGFFTTSAEGEISERFVAVDRVNATESTDSTSYTDLATVGPSVTVTTGTHAWVFIACRMQNGTANAQSNMAWVISGATTRTVPVEATAITVDGLGLGNQAMSYAAYDLMSGALVPGENTFTAKYKSGGVGTAIFTHRLIAVFPF